MKDRKPDVIVGITKSVAAIEAPKIIRQFKREGLSVEAVMSPSSKEIIHPQVVEWACEKKPVIELTGKAEHVSSFDENAFLLICPATLNTISKVSQGIADTSVTSYAAVALGLGLDMAIAPAMHLSLHRNPFYQENLERLEKEGVRIISPRITESKAKIADNGRIVKEVLNTMEKG